MYFRGQFRDHFRVFVIIFVVNFESFWVIFEPKLYNFTQLIILGKITNPDASQGEPHDT